VELITWHAGGGIPIRLTMTLEQVRRGDCAAYIRHLSNIPKIRAQLDAISANVLREELEHDAWYAEALTDHEENLQRILWIAVCGIRDTHDAGI